MQQTLNEFLDEVETKAKIIKSTPDGDIVYAFNIVETKLVQIIREMMHMLEMYFAAHGDSKNMNDMSLKISKILNGELND